MNKPAAKHQSPWKRGRGESTSVYTPQEWYQKMSWVEESEKGDAEAASASKFAQRDPLSQFQFSGAAHAYRRRCSS